jgi:hypothetical protein
MVGGPTGPASAMPASTRTAVEQAVRTGVYKATGDVAFTIYLVKSECPDLNDNGTVKRGLCLAAYPEPRIQMDCPAGAEFQPDFITPISLPYNVFLPKSGRLTVTTFTYSADGLEAGHTTFAIVVKKDGTASGSVVRDQVTTWGTRANCTSGPLTFTARHK